MSAAGGRSILLGRLLTALALAVFATAAACGNESGSGTATPAATSTVERTPEAPAPTADAPTPPAPGQPTPTPPAPTPASDAPTPAASSPTSGALAPTPAAPAPEPPAGTPGGTPTAPRPTPSIGSEADRLRVVSKTEALPPDYVPAGLVRLDAGWYAPGYGPLYLVQDAAAALVEMLRAAEDAGLQIRARSAYRSYDTQVVTFQYWVDVLGEEQARRVSAEPGHSEHQLGTTVDLTSASVGWDLAAEFGETPEGRWLAAHAADFGFALSYPPDAEGVTGYAYEPWHFRYIGREQAREWRASGLVLVEYLRALEAARAPAGSEQTSG